MFALAVLVEEGLAALVAVMVTVGGFGTADGAV